MFGYLLKRTFGMAITLFLIITISFFVIRLAKGSPFSQERKLPPEVQKSLEARYNLDKPIMVQYGQYLYNLVRHGDLGDSIKYPQYKVTDLIGQALPKTIALGLMALAWALLVGVLAGVIASVFQNTWIDYSAMGLALLGISLPSFVLGPLFILLFSLNLLWFPAGGWGEFRHMVLPAITLGTIYAAYVARLTRGGMLEVIRSNFVRTAQAKGLGQIKIMFKHVLRGGILPAVTFLGPAVAHLMVGSVVVEKIFNTPGLGPYFVDAAFNRDYFLIMGIVIVYSVFLLVMNLTVDLTYKVLDPRVTLE